MIVPLLGLLLGMVIGIAMPFSFPAAYARYVAVAILAGIDSVLGGLRSNLEGSFDAVIFVTGFFSNGIFAAGMTYIGDRVGVEIYYAALFAFGVRIFQNLAVMRRHAVQHIRTRYGRRSEGRG